MNYLNKSKGITLIALVITIILLLILAGVTLNIVLNGGLIEKSQTAVDTYSEEQARERLELELIYMKAEKITNGNYNNGDFLTDALNKNEGFKINSNENKIIVDGFEFIIDRDELIIIDENVVTASINYEVQSYNGINEEGKDTANVILSIVSNSNIKEIKIIDPDNKENIKTISAENMSNEIELEINKNFEVNIEMENGKIITKKLNINIGNLYDINFLETDGGFVTTLGESDRISEKGFTGKSFVPKTGVTWNVCELEKNVSFNLSKKFELSFKKKLTTTSNAQMGGIQIILQQKNIDGNYKDILCFFSRDCWEANTNISNSIVYNNSYILQEYYNKSEEWSIIGDGENIKVYCNGTEVSIGSVNQIDGLQVDKIVIEIGKYPSYTAASENYIERIYLGPIFKK